MVNRGDQCERQTGEAVIQARREAIRARTEELIAEEMTLIELRKARKHSQVVLAKKLNIEQSAVSKFSAAPTCT